MAKAESMRGVGDKAGAINRDQSYRHLTKALGRRLGFTLRELGYDSGF